MILNQRQKSVTLVADTKQPSQKQVPHHIFKNSFSLTFRTIMHIFWILLDPAKILILKVCIFIQITT